MRPAPALGADRRERGRVDCTAQSRCSATAGSSVNLAAGLPPWFSEQRVPLRMIRTARGGDTGSAHTLVKRVDCRPAARVAQDADRSSPDPDGKVENRQPPDAEPSTTRCSDHAGPDSSRTVPVHGERVLRTRSQDRSGLSETSSRNRTIRFRVQLPLRSSSPGRAQPRACSGTGCGDSR